MYFLQKQTKQIRKNLIETNLYKEDLDLDLAPLCSKLIE